MKTEASASLEEPIRGIAEFTPQHALPITQAIPAGVAPPGPAEPEPRPRESTPSSGPTGPASIGAPVASELDQLVPEPVVLKEEGVSRRPAPAVASPAAPLPAVAELRREAVQDHARRDVPSRPQSGSPERPIPLVRALPGPDYRTASSPALADLAGPAQGRNLSEVPRFYRSRLDANRTVLAQRSGASTASEQAVERPSTGWLAIKTPMAAGMAVRRGTKTVRQCRATMISPSTVLQDRLASENVCTGRPIRGSPDWPS